MNADKPKVQEYPEYRNIRDNIWSTMPTWQKFIIAIDGRDHSGKSTLGRYLAWQLGMPCIELDTFLIPNQCFIFREKELRKIIESRLEIKRPVIIEGVTIQKVLKQIGYTPDYNIFIRYKSEDLPDLCQDLRDYYSEFEPYNNANYLFDRGYNHSI